MMKYWAQTLSRGGEWVDALGTNSEDSAIQHAKWMRSTCAVNSRVVIKTEEVLVTFRAVSYVKRKDPEEAS